MMTCETPETFMLPGSIHLNIKDKELDFNKAQMIAKDQVGLYYKDTILLSWYDKKRGRYAPHNVECCADGKPGWITYAKSRGGNLSIDVNDEDYVFIFRGVQKVA